MSSSGGKFSEKTFDMQFSAHDLSNFNNYFFTVVFKTNRKSENYTFTKLVVSIS